MEDGIVYLNGQFVPAREARVSVYDRGFRWGDAVYDVTRTFTGRPHKLRRHIDRLFRSLRYTRMDPGLSAEAMEAITLQVLEANRPLLGPNDDFFLWNVVSRGLGIETMMQTESATVAVFAEKIYFQRFAKHYLTGAHVVTPATRRTPPQVLSPRAKISNKMNHAIADFEAKAGDPEAFSVMLDLDGNVAENSGGNFFWVTDGTLYTPGLRNILGGVTRETVLELAAQLGIPAEEGDYPAYDVYIADEAFLTTSSYNILPVTRFNGSPLGESGTVIGSITGRLVQAWNEMVGVDIVAQALSHLPEEERLPVRVRSGSGR